LLMGTPQAMVSSAARCATGLLSLRHAHLALASPSFTHFEDAERRDAFVCRRLASAQRRFQDGI